MRNILVTGASRGIGLAIAERLAGEGDRVIAAARSEGETLRAAIARAKAPGEIRFARVDLADTGGLAAFARDLRAEFGPIDALINNAGIGPASLLAAMAEEEIEKVMVVNALAPILLTRQVLRGMLADGRGRIVSIASIVAANGYNGLSVYSASKAAIVGFSKSLAREVGRVGITVNVISPGFIDTALTADLDEKTRDRLIARSALRRFATPQDIAAMAAYLLSPAADSITGAVMTVDAGATA